MFKVREKRCDQCLFSKAKIVSDERRDQVIEQCLRTECHFLCHKPTESGETVCCRGFFDEHPDASAAMQIARRLQWVEYVE